MGVVGPGRTSLRRVRLGAPTALLAELDVFYRSVLGLRHVEATADEVAVRVGETTLAFTVAPGRPFYHVALLVPGDRFEAALAWARERVELLPDPSSGDVVFDFTNWDARAIYFHDPAGSIVELISHRGVGETGESAAFSGGELLGLSEVGLVGDPSSLAAALFRELALEMWDGAADAEGRLAFVGEKARTLILCRGGRPWLPTGRPAEAHPLEVVLTGDPPGNVPLPAGGSVRRGY